MLSGIGISIIEKPSKVTQQMTDKKSKLSNLEKYTTGDTNSGKGKGGTIMKISYKGFMREMIQRKPVTIGPDASFYEARTLIHDKGIRHLPVIDKKSRLVGRKNTRILPKIWTKQVIQCYR